MHREMLFEDIAVTVTNQSDVFGFRVVDRNTENLFGRGSLFENNAKLVTLIFVNGLTHNSDKILKKY